MRVAIAVVLTSVLAPLPARAQAPTPYDAPPSPPPPPPATVQPAPAPPLVPPPPPRALPPPALVGPAGVYVEVRTSSPDVRIDRIDGGQPVTVCEAPCRRILPRNGIYVIDGSGMRQSSRFMLPDDRNQLTLDVAPGSSAQVVGGVVLAVLGFTTAYVGLVAALANSIAGSDRTVSGVVLFGGLGAGIVGVYLVSTSHTTVVSSTGAVFTDAPARPRKRSAVALTPRGLEF